MLISLWVMLDHARNEMIVARRTSVKKLFMRCRATDECFSGPNGFGQHLPPFVFRLAVPQRGVQPPTRQPTDGRARQAHIFQRGQFLDDGLQSMLRDMGSR